MKKLILLLTLLFTFITTNAQSSNDLNPNLYGIWVNIDGEHLIISEIYQALKEVRGVLDVIKVKYTNISGVDYSGVEFNINKNTSPDGTHLACPKNAVFEIKYPSNDIVGKVI